MEAVFTQSRLCSFSPEFFLEEHDVRGHIGQRVLPEGVFGQADGSQEVGALCDMFTRRGIDGIHEIAADHKGRDAAFPQQADGFCEKIVMNREFPQFGEVRVIQRLLAERGIADYGIYAAGTELTILEASIKVLRFGIEVLRDGRGRGVKFHSHETGIEVFRARPIKLPMPAEGSRMRSGSPLLRPILESP